MSMAKKARSKRSKKEELSEQPVTTETLSDHRRQVLSHARKFVTPLGLSRKKFLLLTLSILLAVLLIFLAFFGLLIYRFKSDGNLVYRVSQIVPYPMLRLDGDY